MSGENGTARYSPPTSPMRVSPATSPGRSNSPVSPPTSPAARSVSPTTSSDSTSQCIPTKRRKKRTLTRTSLQRKQRKLQEEAADDVDPEEESEEEEQCESEASKEDENQYGEVQQENKDGDVNTVCSDISQHCDSPFVSGRDSSNSESESDSVGSNTSRSSSETHLSLSCGSEVSENSDNDGLSQDSCVSLFTGSEMSANEALCTVLKLYVDECWTKSSLDKNIKMIKKMLPQPNEFPSSCKDAFSKLENLTSLCSESEHLFCDDCLQLVSTECETCDHLGGQSKFYIFPIENQIKHMYEERRLASVVDSYREHSSKIFGYICDICDGSEYKRVKKFLPNPYDLILLWNTDGVALSSSSKQELWPVLCTICEVPPRLRSSFIIVAGVYVSGRDPDMNVYLKPICENLKTLWEKGFSWVHPVTKQEVVSKVAAPVLSADAPAKAKVMYRKSHNSRYGCIICEQKSKKVDWPPEEVFDANGRRKPRLRRFLYQDDHKGAARIRTGDRLELLARLAEIRGQCRKGVICRAVISDIPHLDQGTIACAEYLHSVLLGVVKYFLIKIFEETGPWCIRKHLEEINMFISKEIKVPDFVNRRPRKTTDFKYWKASELLAFFLFYSLPLFRDYLPEPFYQHWILLVGAVYILLQEAISEDDMNVAEVMLRLFVRDVGNLYDDKCYSYNVHNLLHLTLLVRRWGPLWATSAFVFETCNGYLGRHVHGTKNFGQELINNIKISQGVAVLENIVKGSPNGVCHDFKSRQLISEALGKPFLKDILNQDEIEAIDSCKNLGTYLLFKRAKIMTNVYTTKIYDSNKKRANSFVEIKHDNDTRKFGQIIVFVKSEHSSLFCLVRTFRTVHLNLFYHETTRHIIRHLLPVEESKELLLIRVEGLLRKVIKVGMYLAVRPNSYEINL